MSLSGSLLGLALGDAIGFVVESAEPAVAATYVAEVLRGGRVGERGRPPWPFGQYSDDTQLARELLLAVREGGGFAPHVFARRIARLFAENRVVGAGPGSRAAAERLGTGVPWPDAGTPAPYAGNGAAMRVGPLGALCAEDPDRLAAWARDQALVTHRDSRAVAGAVAVATAVGLAATSGPLDRGALLDRIAGAAGATDRSVAAAVRGVAGWLDLEPDDVADRVPLLEAPVPGRARRRGVSPFVTSGVVWSLYAFLRSPDDYWETLCTAISIGGDTDTVAAMAGAMSGARGGLEALPTHLLDRLTDCGTWGWRDLSRLAQDCEAAVRGVKPDAENSRRLERTAGPGDPPREGPLLRGT